MKDVIIFFPHIGEYGGIERNIIALAIEVNRRGYNPILLCYYDEVGMAKLEGSLTVVELGDSKSTISKILKLRRWFSERKYVNGMPLFFGAKAGFYGGFGCPVPYSLHYTDPPSLLKDKERGLLMRLAWIPRKLVSGILTKHGVKAAGLRLTMTEWNARELAGCYGLKFDVVYQGGIVPEGKINTAPRCQGPNLRLFSICRLNESKNLTWMLDAVAALAKSKEVMSVYKNLEVVIAGKGPAESDLKKHADFLRIGEIVCFPGFLNPEEVEEEFRKADLFLVPGRQGFGLPILEAFYRCVPVVMNKESRISEMLGENPWAFISENSSISFSSALLEGIQKIRHSYPDRCHLEAMPTERGWAAEIGRRCGWW